MPFAPFPVSTDDLVSYSTDAHGTEVNTKQLFEASEHFNCSLLLSKSVLRITSKALASGTDCSGKLEQTYQAPAAAPAIEQNLIPSKDENYVPFGNFILM